MSIIVSVRRVATAAGGLVGLAASAPAGAAPAGATPVISSGTSTFMLGSAIVVSTLGLAIWAYCTGRDAMRRARHERRASDRLAAILDSVPAAYVLWVRDGDFSASPRLGRWLGKRRGLMAFSDLFDASGRRGFAAAGFARLEEAAAAARTGGALPAPFEVAGAERNFRVVAERAGAGRTASALLWFVDLSDQRAEISARDQLVSRLEDENRNLHHTLDGINFPVWRRGGDLSLGYVNTAYIRAVEAADAETVLREGIELVGNALTGSSRDDAARAQDEERGLATKHYVVIDGQRRALLMQNTPDGGAGAQAGVTGYAVDRTELEDARAEFARYMESHAETLNKLSTAVAIFGADKTLEFYNNAFTRLWRLPEEWMSSRPHHSELLEEMRERRRLPEQADFPAWKRAHLAHYTQLLEPLEEMWHLPDGATLRVVTQPHPLGGLLIFYEDVTDRLALERNYNTLIAVQRATLNSLHEGIAVIGSDGRLKLSNPAFLKVWHLDEGAITEAPHLSDLLTEAESYFDVPAEYEKFRALLYDDGERVVRGGRLSRKDGSEIDFAAVPLPDGATLYTFVDVTDSLRIERALRERNEALETSDRLKTEFVAHISYELRTPLNNVMGFAELLDKEYYGALNAQQHTYARNILESSAQLMVLINDILDLSVVEAGGIRLETRLFDIGQTLRNVAAMAREELKKRNHILQLEIPPGLGMIDGDEKRIRQVMYNLLSNAMKFTPPHGQITLGGGVDNDFVTLFVTDTGIGIPADEQLQVFERFHTGRDVPRGQGAGLGLSLVRSFVELHGGTVTLSSEPNAGTRILCRLPRHQPSTSVVVPLAQGR
ncbi:sensor histidine kinase [Govanella unica]|uniref:histidine kinase n=1 Tax=Govanella unica TaxID=2975056 RepID=A0A9X3TZZ6_9PROT|nr:PAS domain-containing sensor histidine kinase [Govania unica]MDA5194572.1 PAS-domain containing protein [Govania unica]